METLSDLFKVESRFSITSREWNAEYLSTRLPWRVIEADSSFKDQHITVFDFGIGQHQRVDFHLIAVKRELLKHEEELNALSFDSGYALWVSYKFPAAEGDFGIDSNLAAGFALLKVALRFQLHPVTQ